MSTPPRVEPFKGKDWAECCDFIVAVRNRARWEGKQRDAEWMADFAAPNFYGKALSWHVRLPRDVRGDWEKLEVALMDRWSPPDSDEDRAKIEPTPAAAPVPNTVAPTNAPTQGLIKIIPNGSKDLYYAKWGDTMLKVTDNREDALLLRFDPIPRTNLLKAINNSSLLPMALTWGAFGSPRYGWIGYPGSPPDSTSDLTWTLSSIGELTVGVREANGSVTHLSAFIKLNRGIYSMCFVVDPVAYGKEWKNEKRASLFLEPIE